MTNQGTGLLREAVTDVSGEFALTALPSGRYTLRIELQGFKTYTNDALELRGPDRAAELHDRSRAARGDDHGFRTFTARRNGIGRTKGIDAGKRVRTLPLSRRNITGLLTLSTGVTEASTGLAGGGNIRLNGVAEGGTAITVDGTDATANNETRGLNSYGAQNQISVM